MEVKDEPKTWPELAISLYDKLTGRDAEIAYDFDDFELSIPSRAGDNPEHTRWKLNGTIRICTRDGAEG